MWIPSNFCIQQSEMMYTNIPRQKIIFGIQRKLTKNKVIPNHSDLDSDQNRVLDMASFETNFLSNHN